MAKTPKYDGYQRGLASMVHKFFDKKTVSGAIATSKVGVSVKELVQELHKPAIKQFKKRKVYARFKGYLHFKTILCHRVALDVQLIIFFI